MSYLRFTGWRLSRAPLTGLAVILATFIGAGPSAARISLPECLSSAEDMYDQGVYLCDVLLILPNGSGLTNDCKNGLAEQRATVKTQCYIKDLGNDHEENETEVRDNNREPGGGDDDEGVGDPDDL